MSVEIIDSFAHYAIGDILTKGYLSISAADAIVTGRYGASSKALRFASGSNLKYLLSTNQTKVISGHGFQMTTAFPVGECEVVSFQDGTSTQVMISITNSGAFKVYRGAGSTLLGTSTYTLTLNNWIHLSVKVLISSTVGTVEVRVNNSPIITLSGINTQATANTRITQMTWGFNGFNSGFNGSAYYSDLYLFNDLGSTCNDFAGDCRVNCQFATGNGTTQNFTRNSGTNNYAMINEAAQDGDTTYNSDATANDIDLYTFPAISGANSIFAVQSVLTARKDDAGTRTLGNIIRSNSVNYTGALNVNISGSYVMYKDVAEVDPNTSAAWTQAAVNAAQFGPKVIA